MDTGIIFIILFSLIIIGCLVLAMIYRKNFKEYIDDNKALSILLAVFIVSYITYQLHLYQEHRKKKDIYQTKQAINSCPDYWINVSKSKDELKCKNTHNLGRYDLGGIKDFGTEFKSRS